jgi:hypothetical protein
MCVINTLTLIPEPLSHLMLLSVTYSLKSDTNKLLLAHVPRQVMLSALPRGRFARNGTKPIGYGYLKIGTFPCTPVDINVPPGLISYCFQSTEHFFGSHRTVTIPTRKPKG